jgi:succinate dehydrogenase/fumarate reductase flavoprotein subunit
MINVSKVPERWDMQVDLVSVGASSGGLTAVIMGHDLGLSTALLEKSEWLGGGTALSGGVLWIPFNHIMLEQGLADSRKEALTHIRHTSLGRHDEELVATYLDTGPELVRYIQENTPLKLTIEASTDYYAELPGGKKRGRQLYPDPERMIPVLKEAEKIHPLIAKVRRDPVPFFVGVRDRWSEGRGLIGGLVLGCVNRGIDVRTGIRARQLIRQEGRVIGLRAECNGKDFYIKANRGVLLASGGYEWNAEMNKRFMNCPSLLAFTPNSNEGDGHIMGMEVGAAVALMDHSIYQPVYHVEGEESEGKPLYRPLAYGYPGNILVNRHGKRCCNESFYPDIGRAFLAYDKLTSQLANVPMFWIADQENVDRSGMGILATMTKNTDWLIKADTLPELADKLGIPADSLVETVDRFNKFAQEGTDPDFHRGEGAYQHYWGDKGAWAGREPSATLGPLEKPSFHGIRLQLGTVGNLGGLVVNRNAQVVNTQGEIIPGLYGTSNTTALLTHGFTYTSGSCQAKSMIFGYIAAQHMARGK